MKASSWSRRDFLGTSWRAAMALPAAGLMSPLSASAEPARRYPPGTALRPMFPDPARRWRGDSSVAAFHRLDGGRSLVLAGPQTPAAAAATASPPPLSERFTDLRRHFIFEYYPWYGGPPYYEHWEQWDRRPPLDLGSPYVPYLGAYEVRSRRVLEQHARWIADSGAGAIAASWWGPGSFEDRAAHLLFDVMRDHDLKVTFALEPYRSDRGQSFASDVLYLLREYGEKRSWDAFLILADEQGREGPVFKGFRMILGEEAVDCLGRRHRVPDYTPDGVWRRQTDMLRDALRREFDRVTLLADSLELRRTPASGFDGIGIYDNFIPPEAYARYAAGASMAGLVFSFNVNPGFDSIEPRFVGDDPCYAPLPFAPPTEGIDWTRAEGRELAARRSEARIVESFEATVKVQTDPALANVPRGFFLAYINSFNEWHEGHAFEPMKDDAQITPEERPFAYHNPARGGYRLEALARLIGRVLSPAPRRNPQDLLRAEP